MELIRAKLMSLCVYKNILETEPVRSLLALAGAKAPEDMLRGYGDLIHSVYSAGYVSLSECLSWHLKFDKSFVGNAVAAGTASQALLDAAALDIRRLSGVGQVTCASLKRKIYDACVPISERYGSIIQNLPELAPGREFTEEEIFESYRRSGCGMFALGRAFYWEKRQLYPVKELDAMEAGSMIGYEAQRNAVLENTRILMRGRQANNVLLYGDSGTGKSATVKSMLTVPEFYNLRLIQIAKSSLAELTVLTRELGTHTQKFIIYIDDLSFDQEDKAFSALKTALEGGLERRPDNVVIYVTSNRRHMVRERFSDRQGDDVHAKETLEEHSSLSDRFGLRIAYLALDKRRYTDMVLELCHRKNVPLSDYDIRVEANHWELRHGSRTPRVAMQLAEHLAGKTAAEEL